MAADNGCGWIEREELAADRLQDLIGVSSPKVCPANRAAKERVSRKEDRAVSFEQEAGRARGVAGRMDDAHGKRAEGDLFIVGQRLIRRQGRLKGQSEGLPLFLEPIVERPI